MHAFLNYVVPHSPSACVLYFNLDMFSTLSRVKKSRRVAAHRILKQTLIKWKLKRVGQEHLAWPRPGKQLFIGVEGSIITEDSIVCRPKTLGAEQ